jgi:ABC-type multidrug transport system fused ATPase/permease subunit
MKFKKIIEELKDYIVQINFDDFVDIYMSFPSDWDMTPFFDDNQVYILENPKKTFEDNDRVYNIYQFILKSVDYTDELFNILVQIKNTFLEREKMFFELNKKLEQEKKELEENINKKINSIRTTQSNKKQKNEITEKIEEVEELKNIDSTMSISEIMTNYNK